MADTRAQHALGHLESRGGFKLYNFSRERCAKEENFEKLQQQQRAKVVEHQQKNTNTFSTDDYRKRAEEVSSFTNFQEKDVQEFLEEREKLIKEQEKKMAEVKKRYYEKLLELEGKFDVSLDELMNKHGLCDVGDLINRCFRSSFVSGLSLCLRYSSLSFYLIVSNHLFETRCSFDGYFMNCVNFRHV